MPRRYQRFRYNLYVPVNYLIVLPKNAGIQSQPIYRLGSFARSGRCLSQNRPTPLWRQSHQQDRRRTGDFSSRRSAGVALLTAQPPLPMSRKIKRGDTEQIRYYFIRWLSVSHGFDFTTNATG